MDTAADKDLVHWVAEQDGDLIGVFSVRIIHKMPSPEDMDGRFGYLTNSYVLPRHRNAGVGAALLAAIKNWALGERLELLVVWPSERAYALYERSGYERHRDPVILKLNDGLS
jgi:GNAT superfamily N-acetyltransferase